VGGGPDRGRRRRSGLDVGARQRPAVLLVVGLADLALGLLARYLPIGTGDLNGDGYGADNSRGDSQGYHGGNDEVDHRAHDQERDYYAGPDGCDLEPAHPPHPFSTKDLPLAILPDLARSGRAVGARRRADRYAGAMQALGIDIGGSGIKAAPVDVTTGKFLADRQKIATPRPALPDAVADVVKQLTTAFSWSGPIGITFPGVVTDGVTRTAANLDPAWIGVDAATLFGTAASNPVRVLNDADAAGVAEMTFGAGLGQKGTVLMLTFGTGIGSALFTRGVLVPNTEFGHIEIRGHDAETRASERAKELHDLSWGKWAGRVDEYLQHIEALLSPHLIIVGGGVSKQSDKWVPRLTGIRARVVPASLLNDAGIVGAAMATSSESAPDTSGATGTGR
jgi:polyphosphate glucokinase